MPLKLLILLGMPNLILLGLKLVGYWNDTFSCVANTYIYIYIYGSTRLTSIPCRFCLFIRAPEVKSTTDQLAIIEAALDKDDMTLYCLNGITS